MPRREQIILGGGTEWCPLLYGAKWRRPGSEASPASRGILCIELCSNQSSVLVP